MSGGASGLDSPISGLLSNGPSESPALAASAYPRKRWSCGYSPSRAAIASSSSATPWKTSSGAVVATNRSMTLRSPSASRRTSARRSGVSLSPIRSGHGDGASAIGGTGMEGEIDHERRMIRRRLPLARVAIDQCPLRLFGQRLRREHQVDPHAEVLVEVARSVVPPRIQAADVVVAAEHVDE